MNSGKKIASLLAGGALTIAAVPLAGTALASEAVPDGQSGTNVPAADASAESHVARALGARQVIQHVQGVFAWNQDAITDNATLAKDLYQSPAYLCGAQGDVDASLAAEAGKPAAIDFIEVTGDVENAFTASVADFKQKAPMRKIMGCTCFGNPTDGRASANADVAGFRLSALVNEAAPVEGANTITFTSRDGYQVALPLQYVMQRYSLMVTTVNDEDAADAVGCANQLWPGGTSARSFARDVVSISITKEAEPPAAPGSGASGAVPNVGVTEGIA